MDIEALAADIAAAIIESGCESTYADIIECRIRRDLASGRGPAVRLIPEAAQAASYMESEGVDNESLLEAISGVVETIT